MNTPRPCEECGELVHESSEQNPLCRTCISDLGIGRDVARGVGLTGGPGARPPAGDRMPGQGSEPEGELPLM